MAFNSAEINEFSDIWVFCEQREGKLMNTDFELISEGRKLADERGSKLVGILLGGEGIEAAARELGGYGADRVIVCEDPALAVYTTDAYCDVICDVVMEKKPEVLLIGASNIGRDLGPRVAARLHTGLTADCTHLDIDMNKYVQFLRESSTIDVDSVKFKMEDTNLKMTRPAFGGHLMATIICPRFRPCMSTVRPGVMKKAEFDQAKADACQIEKAAVKVDAAALKTRVLEVVKETRPDPVSHQALSVSPCRCNCNSANRNIIKVQNLKNTSADIPRPIQNHIPEAFYVFQMFIGYIFQKSRFHTQLCKCIIQFQILNILVF